MNEVPLNLDQQAAFEIERAKMLAWIDSNRTVTPDGSVPIAEHLFNYEVAALDNMKVKIAQLRESYKMGDVSIERVVEYLQKFRSQLSAEQVNNSNRVLGGLCGVCGWPPHLCLCESFTGLSDDKEN